MTATAQLPPAAKATVDTVREGLADIRDRLAELDGPDWQTIAEVPQQLVDKATGRNRRPRWPFVALGVLAVVGLAVGVAMFMMNRSSMEQMSDDLESEEDGVWTPGGSTHKAPTTHRSSMPEMDAQSFPASDAIQTPMSPSVGS